jgi:NADH dehydrogenase
VVGYLLEKNWNVVALVRSGKLNIHSPNLKIVKGDIRSQNLLIQELKNIKYIVHLAGAKQDESDSYEINVGGIKNIIEAAKVSSVGLIVNISTISTRISKKGIYGKTKLIADGLIEKSGIDYITLKPSIIYGDINSGILGSISKFSFFGLVPVFGSGKCKFRPIHVLDVARSIEVALTEPALRNNVFDVVGPDLLSYNEIISLFGDKVFNKKFNPVHFPVKFGFFIAKFSSYFLYKSPITQSNILGSNQDTEMNFDKFYSSFKLKPKSFSEGLKFIKDESLIFDEANLILSYVSSLSNPKITVTEKERSIYYKVRDKASVERELDSLIYRNKFILGPLDIFSTLFYKNGVFAQKMNIASAIIECSTISSAWLTPKIMSKFDVIKYLFKLSVNLVFKLIGAVLLLPFQNFIKRNVA